MSIKKSTIFCNKCTSLNLNKCVEPINKQVFLLPNHDSIWLKYLIKIIEVNNCKKILVVGYLYGLILSEVLVDRDVVIVDNDPLAILAQSFAVWLTKTLKKNSALVRSLLFLDYYKINQDNFETKKVLTAERYERTFLLFNKFVNLHLKNEKLSNESIINLYRLIFQIESSKDKFYIVLKRKGFNYFILQNDFTRPIFGNRIIVDSLTNVKGDFDFIITTNVIDYLEDKNEFINKMHDLLREGGFVELHTYKKEVQDFIKNKYKPDKSKRFAYAFLFQEKSDCFRYIKKKIFLNKTFFVIKKSELKN